MELLRQSLLADPYFKNVPSMQPEERKTAVTFHAKNDLPEVRREVFRVIAGFDVTVRAVIRRKSVLAQSAQTTRKNGGKGKFAPNDLYDDMVKRLFTNQLHQADETRIFFARRGKTARKDALEQAIEKAKRRNHPEEKKTIIDALYPSECGCLQIIDYFMWALQRFLERGESRFFEMLASSFASIKDLDDTRVQKTGEWYSATNPLTRERLLAQ